MTRLITIDEVKKHRRKSSVWIIIHNDVYDVTSYLGEHPGGEESLLSVAGKDGTQIFEDIGHSEDARELMKKFKIGSLPPDQHNRKVEICCKSKSKKKSSIGSRSKCSICSAASRSEPIKSESKKPNCGPRPERRLGSIVVPTECTIPSCRPRGYPCGGFNYKWAILALAGALVLGGVLKKYLAR